MCEYVLGHGLLLRGVTMATFLPTHTQWLSYPGMLSTLETLQSLSKSSLLMPNDKSTIHNIITTTTSDRYFYNYELHYFSLSLLSKYIHNVAARRLKLCVTSSLF